MKMWVLARETEHGECGEMLKREWLGSQNWRQTLLWPVLLKISLFGREMRDAKSEWDIEGLEVFPGSLSKRLQLGLGRLKPRTRSLPSRWPMTKHVSSYSCIPRHISRELGGNWGSLYTNQYPFGCLCYVGDSLTTVIGCCFQRKM